MTDFMWTRSERSILEDKLLIFQDKRVLLCIGKYFQKLWGLRLVLQDSCMK